MRILGTAVNGAKATVNLVGAPSFSKVNPYGLYDHFKADDYASSYPSIRAITNEFIKITPHAIGANGQPAKHAALDALFHPNRVDSLPMFMEKVGVSVLCLPITYILVWRNEGGVAQPGGDFGFKGKNIAGYTFLERPAIDYRDGTTYYKIGAQEFTDDEVMAIPGGTRPNKLYAGYSPSMAACRWATLDSYIADFQKGFFENGAIPAGQMIITSASNTDFEDTKKTLQEKHRGVDNNNNIVYVPRPVGQDGKPADAKIEWIPFAQSNKDIDFKPLLEHVDNRLSEAYGVSSIIKGVDNAAKYSNAEVSENGFAKRAVDPLALRIYSQITHELNRMTGGLGVAITYKYEIPAISDQEKVRADTKLTESEIISKMTSEPYNYTLESVVEAFQLSNSYKLLKQGAQPTVIDNDKPEVDEGNETESAPDPSKIDGITPINKATVKAELTDEEKLEAAARALMQKQVDRAVAELKDNPIALEEPTETEVQAFIQAMMAVVSGILIANGESEYAAGVLAAGLSLDDLQGFTFTSEADDAYRQYLRRVANSYGNETADSIRKVLAEAAETGLNRKEMEANLKEIMNTDEWRVNRLARTELNNSQNIGKLEGIKSLSAETNVDWEKTIDHSGVTPCPLCQSREGVWTALEQPLWGLGESIRASEDNGDTTIYVNDWQANEANDYHPNGRGTLVFRRSL